MISNKDDILEINKNPNMPIEEKNEKSDRKISVDNYQNRFLNHVRDSKEKEFSDKQISEGEKKSFANDSNSSSSQNDSNDDHSGKLFNKLIILSQNILLINLIFYNRWRTIYF